MQSILIFCFYYEYLVVFDQTTASKVKMTKAATIEDGIIRKISRLKVQLLFTHGEIQYLNHQIKIGELFFKHLRIEFEKLKATRSQVESDEVTLYKAKATRVQTITKNVEVFF